jgi:hypothetical protein
MADTIDGADLLTVFDFRIEAAPGFIDPPEVTREEITVAREVGTRSRSHRLNGRRFPINGWIASADADAAKANIRLLKSLALRGVLSTVDIRLDDFTGYKVLGTYDGFTAEPVGQQRVARKWRVNMQFRATNPPTFISLTPSVISSITTSDVEIPMGTAPPIGAVLAIFEPTNPVITLKNHNGVTIGTPMEFTFTPVSGEYLVIAITRGEIWRNLTGLAEGTEASSAWTPGTSMVRLSDFAQWDALTDSWMTMAISDGEGELTYEQCDF